MGEAEWFQPTVSNKLSQAIILANFSIQYNPYNETASVQGTAIGGQADFEWGHCGRANTPTGTEGSFEVHLANDNEKIAEISWDCPWSPGGNKLVKSYVKPGYDISFDGFSMSWGAMGKGSVSVIEV